MFCSHANLMKQSFVDRKRKKSKIHTNMTNSLHNFMKQDLKNSGLDTSLKRQTNDNSRIQSKMIESIIKEQENDFQKEQSISVLKIRKRHRKTSLKTKFDESEKADIYEPYERRIMFRIQIISKYLIAFLYCLIMMNVTYSIFDATAFDNDTSSLITMTFYIFLAVLTVIKGLFLYFLDNTNKIMVVVYFYLDLNFIFLFELSFQLLLDLHKHYNYYLLTGIFILCFKIYLIIDFRKPFNIMIIDLAILFFSMFMLVVVENTNDLRLFAINMLSLLPLLIYINLQTFVLNLKSYDYFKKSSYFELCFLAEKYFLARKLKKEDEEKLYSISDYMSSTGNLLN